MNTTQLIGRLTKDIELRQISSGTEVTQFTLAVSRDFKDKDGNRGADFIQCVAWKKTAELLEQYTHKGSRIGVIGHIQTRNYENQKGERVYVTEVVIDRMEFLDTKAESEQGQRNGYQNGGYQGGRKQPQQPASDPFAGAPANKAPIDITDDDLPF